MREIGQWIKNLNTVYKSVRWLAMPYDIPWLQRDLQRHTDVALPTSIDYTSKTCWGRSGTSIWHTTGARAACSCATRRRSNARWTCLLMAHERG